MGVNSSLFDSPPSGPTPLSRLALFFRDPWREMNWRDKAGALQYVKDYRPQTEGQQLRILLYGPVGSGKSSFINSVDSVLQGRVCTRALADSASTRSFTKEYTTYKLQKGSPQTFYPFVLNDMMGLETIKGIKVHDMKLALKGHVKDGFKFNPESTLSENDQFYNKQPTGNDIVHVLVCVVPADTVSQMTEESLKRIRDIRMEASDLKIPQVVILTKIDEACPEIKEDLKNVYKAKFLKTKMEEFSSAVGFPMNCIFPVKNYDSEIELDGDVDALILSALRNILNFGDDFINFKSPNVQTDMSEMSLNHL